MVMYFIKNDDFIIFFHNFPKMGITIFPKAPGGCGSCVEIGTGSDPLPAVADRLAYLWNRKAAIPAIGDPQKKVKISDSLGGSRFLTLLQ